MSGTTACAAGLLGVAAALAVPLRVPTPGRLTRSRSAQRRPLVLVLAVLVAAPAALLGDHGLVLGGVAAGVVAGASRLRTVRRRADDARQAAVRVAEFCESAAAELAAGAPPHRALTVAAEEAPGLTSVVAASVLGADVPAAMRNLAGRAGHADLQVVAAAWQVALRSGGGLADPLERAAATLRERRRTARVVHAELAPARATARLMAALPAVFLVAGSGLGGHPVHFLLSTTPGSACLVAGLLLSYAGLAWLEKIAADVEGEPP